MLINKREKIKMSIYSKVIEAISQMEGGGEKRGWWRGANSSMIYLIHCKNLCKCRNVLPPSTTIKKTQFIFS
jgi:hypothetical protein